jgi:hypothetical protein
MASVIRAGRSLSRTSVLLHKRRLLTTFGFRLFSWLQKCSLKIENTSYCGDKIELTISKIGLGTNLSIKKVTPFTVFKRRSGFQACLASAEKFHPNAVAQRLNNEQPAHKCVNCVSLSPPKAP